jgi:hypothetical protein
MHGMRVRGHVMEEAVMKIGSQREREAPICSLLAFSMYRSNICPLFPPEQAKVFALYTLTGE